MQESRQRYCGRFAPTPSGPLHFGSLVTAVASYCHARSQEGTWLVRMEDVDTPRVVKGSADDILQTLERFGFEWDGDVLYQSQRFDDYEQIIRELIRDEQVYRCQCSRKSLIAEGPEYGPLGMIYPGHCRNKKLSNPSASLRLNVGCAGIQSFHDDYNGPFQLDVSRQVGDPVLKRVDGIYAYHLAVVADDDYQQVNHIVRGIDLLEVTAIHLYLYDLLAFRPPGYLHVPLIKTADGKKLSKQTGAAALDRHNVGTLLVQALTFLGQKIETGLESASAGEILSSAINNWDASRIPPVGRVNAE